MSDNNENRCNKISNAVLYARTSRSRATEGSLSAEAQIEELLRYCKSRNIAVAGVYFERGVGTSEDLQSTLRRMVSTCSLPPATSKESWFTTRAGSIGTPPSPPSFKRC
jgi:hypothetical protein